MQFGVLLSIVFVLEISAAIFATVIQSQIGEMLQRTMMDALQNYPESAEVSNAVNFMQLNVSEWNTYIYSLNLTLRFKMILQLGCCGVSNLRDWEGILDGPEGTSNATIIVPASCCKQSIDNTCEEYIMTGCLERMELIFAQSAIIIASGAISVAFVQVRYINWV